MKSQFDIALSEKKFGKLRSEENVYLGVRLSRGESESDIASR